MLIVALGWIYVVLMAALAEALSPQGTLLGAAMTFMLYGVLPLAIVLYLMGTPGRKRLLRQREVEASSEISPATLAVPPTSPPASPRPALDPDGRGHAAARAVEPIAPVRKES